MSQIAAGARARRGGVDRALPVVTAGLISGFLAAAFSISDATFVFGLSMPSALPAGIGLALISTAILAAVTAMTSSIPGVVAQTQEVPLATLAVVAATLLASLPAGAGETAAFTTLVVTIGLSTLATGLFFFLLGFFRLGRFIRFVPLPTIAGFIAGMGWILFHGSIEVIGGHPLSIAEFQGWLTGTVALKLLLAGGLVAALFLVPRRSASPLAVPAVIVGTVLLFHFVALLSGTDGAALAAAGWFVTLDAGGALWDGYGLLDLGQADWGLALGQSLTVATMIIVSGLALLMTSSAIELAIQRDVAVDGELKAAGVANLCAGLAGGFPGFQAFGLTLLNWRLGAAHRGAGLVVALVCLAVMLLGAPIFDVVPLPVFGGLLLWLSLSLLHEWLVGTWRRLGRGEYAIVVLIVVVIASAGFLEGLLVGLIAGVVLFVVDYSRVDIVNARLSGRVMHSSTELSGEQQKLLASHGEAILILRLQGYIFFGTADRLRERIRGWLKGETAAGGAGATRTAFLLIDFRRASGIDSSAVMSFVRLSQYAAQNDFRIVLTNLPPAIRTALLRGGLNFGEDGRVRAYETLDRGLRWCEKKLLLRLAPLAGDTASEIREQLLPAGADPGAIERLLAYMSRLELAADALLVEQGADSHEMYFIEAGRVSVHLAKSDGQSIRLKTLGPGTTVGELAFYLNQRRSASVRCDGPAVLWRFRRADLERMERDAPDLAALFHQRMATLLCERLTATNRLVQVLID